MAVFVQQLETESVNGSEPGAIECCQDFGPWFRDKNLFARALLHFIGSAIGKSDDDETRQHLLRIAGLGELGDAIRHRAGLPRPGRRDHGKIPVEFLGKTIAGALISRLRHHELSSSNARSGWVCSQRSSMISGSIASVASG